jgi:LacI family transcriptional regulator
MKGGRPPKSPVLIAPSGVKTRQSTDVLAIADPNVSRALHLIREQGCLGLGVDEVAAAAGLSRSVLQRRFRKILGKTVHQEILDIRLKRACTLLAETDLPLIEVAEQAGFTHQEYLGVVFRTRLGMTPAQFRREAGDRQ